MRSNVRFVWKYDITHKTLTDLYWPMCLKVRRIQKVNYDYLLENFNILKIWLLFLKAGVRVKVKGSRCSSFQFRKFSLSKKNSKKTTLKRDWITVHYAAFLIMGAPVWSFLTDCDWTTFSFKFHCKLACQACTDPLYPVSFDDNDFLGVPVSFPTSGVRRRTSSFKKTRLS